MLNALVITWGDKRPHYPWGESLWSTFPVSFNLSSKDDKSKQQFWCQEWENCSWDSTAQPPWFIQKERGRWEREGNTLLRPPEWWGPRRDQTPFLEATFQGNIPQPLHYTLRWLPSHIHAFKWLTFPDLYRDPVFLPWNCNISHKVMSHASWDVHGTICVSGVGEFRSNIQWLTTEEEGSQTLENMWPF